MFCLSCIQVAIETEIKLDCDREFESILQEIPAPSLRARRPHQGTPLRSLHKIPLRWPQNQNSTDPDCT